MSRLAELIAELCPDGVEYRPLGELLAYQQPTPFLVSSKDYDPSYPTPVLTAGATFLLGYSSETHGVYVASTDDPVIIFDDFTTASKWVDFPFKLKSSAAKILTAADPNVADMRFLYFLMQTLNYQVGSHTRHWIAVYSKMRVCCPPLEVQQEIVRILDQFTTLEAELEAELEARRTQYEHYRNHLLSYDSLAARGPVTLVPLGECIKLRFGERITKLHHAGTLYPVYGGGGASFMTDSFNRSDEFVISRFALSEVCVRYVSGEFWLLDSGITFDVDESRCVKRYVGQFLLSRQIAIYRKTAGAAQRNLKTTEFLSMEVPLPELSEQQRIADLLDRFDALVNDISSGLPAEINARRTQYEYYRDRLLSFPEKQAD